MQTDNPETYLTEGFNANLCRYLKKRPGVNFEYNFVRPAQ